MGSLFPKEVVKRHFGLRIGYQAGRDELPALQAEADDLYEQMGAVRPAVSRVTIKPAK